jgi:hypothetical protein
MFKITSTHALTWTWTNLLKLKKGENTFPSEASIPAGVWPKLERFKTAKIVSFERTAGGDKPPTLAELTEADLFNMSKPDLLKLAQASGIAAADDASKKALIDALLASKKDTSPTSTSDTAGEAGDDEEIEISEASLAKLNFKELQALAEQMQVDVTGMTSKKAIADALLADAAEGADDSTSDA